MRGTQTVTWLVVAAVLMLTAFSLTGCICGNTVTCDGRGSNGEGENGDGGEISNLPSFLYWAIRGTGSEYDGKIVRITMEGKSETMLSGLGDPHAISLDTSASKLYWSERIDGITKKANLDGSNGVTLIDKFARDLGLDLVNDKVYWTTGAIHRANLDGSNAERIIAATDLPSSTSNPAGIAVHPANGKIYWAMRTGEIQRANLDGSNVENIVTGVDHAEDVEIYPTKGKIYWTAPALDRIQRANLDGSDVENVVMNIPNPWRLELDLDHKKIYWSDSCAVFPGGDDDNCEGKIKRSDLNGDTIEDVVININSVQGLALGN